MQTSLLCVSILLVYVHGEQAVLIDAVAATTTDSTTTTTPASTTTTTTTTTDAARTAPTTATLAHEARVLEAVAVGAEHKGPAGSDHTHTHKNTHTHAHTHGLGRDAADHHEAKHVIADLKPSEVGNKKAQVSELMFPSVFHLSQFALVTLASFQVGVLFKAVGLPAISGYMVCGMLSGPHILALLEHDSLYGLRLLDQLTIAAICLTAGAEMEFTKLKKHLPTIGKMMCCIMSVTFTITFLTVLMLSKWIPFESGMKGNGNLAVALLISTVLLARSPASAIAIVKDIKASGPYTSITLGVSITVDAVLIVVFSLMMEMSKSLLHGDDFELWTIFASLGSILFSTAFGLLLGLMVDRSLGSVVGKSKLLSPAILGLGWLPFLFDMLSSDAVEIEPLLTCVVAGIWLTNKGRNPEAFHSLLDASLSYINIIFFTSAGAELALNRLLDPVSIVLSVGLFIVRLFSLYVGASVGSYASVRPAKERKVAWMGYVTQAGVGMGLAKDVALEFPSWGTGFASLMISVIFLNQLVGPTMFKHTLNLLGETGGGARQTVV